VVVHDLNVPRGAFSPLGAYPPSIIDADAVLPVTVAEQPFEAIPRRDSQVLGSLGPCQSCAPAAAAGWLWEWAYSLEISRENPISWEPIAVASGRPMGYENTSDSHQDS
jgi:hypothetical protein